MVIFGILLATLVGGSIWYFACGGMEEDNRAEGKDKGWGCITSLILGLIGALIMFGFAALEAD